MINQIFGSGGILSNCFKNYRPRAGQVEIAHLVDTCLKEGKHVLVEGPTGTGKSLATGLPAALHSARTGTCIVYCTANKILQDQLIRQDLPLIKTVIDTFVDEDDEDEKEGFEFGAIKGMSNYLCVNALEEAEEREALPRKLLRALRDFSDSIDVADVADFETNISDAEWSQVSVGPESCLKGDCPIEISDCHIHKARKRVEQSHLIVTNYHLLFIDAELRKQSGGLIGILPHYSVIVMDEAHEIVDIAMDFRGYSISKYSVTRILNLLKRTANDETVRLTQRLTYAFNELQLAINYLANRSSILEEPLKDDYGAISILSDIEKFLKVQIKAMREHLVENKKIARMVQMCQACNKLQHRVSILCYGITYKKNTTEEGYYDLGDGNNIGIFPNEHVFYFEKRKNSDDFDVRCKVLDASEWLYLNIFSEKKAVITSATLSTSGQDLSFMAKQLGLKDKSYSEFVASSPFDGERTLAIIPEENVIHPSNDEFPAYLAKTLYDVLMSLDRGGVLALFTSYKNLNKVKELISLCLPRLYLFVQGDMGKRQIIEGFKKAHEEGRKALILATASFWQGVDIPGEALSIVFIDKIPFCSPEDPVYWYLNKKDPAAFFKYSVPKAAIALKQGVGRLIRSETDYGVVIICDIRLTTKQYGKRLINAVLPSDCFVSSDLKDIPEFFAQFRQ